MIRFIVRTAIALAANAVGLLVAAALLDGVQLDAGGFIVAVVVFAAFIWAARKDGEVDRALQRRLGIKRRTRIGR